MKKYILLFVVFSVFIISCKEDATTKTSKYGQTLRINEPDYFRTLQPQNLKDAVSSHLVTQIYEGLVKFDPKTTSVAPAIARFWEISNDTIYTFHLRKDAYFHDNPCFSGGKGRLITADDIKYTFERLCTFSDDNKNFFGTLDKIVGTYKYFEASANGKPDFDIEGIKVVDDSTLQIIIEKPIPFFLNLLANPVTSIIPKEGITAYGNDNFVGSGPYMLKELPKKNEPLYLLKNKNYYKKDSKGIQLPYLDSIKVTFIGSTRQELQMLDNSELDMVLSLPTEYINSFFESHKNDFLTKPPKFILEQVDETSSLYNLKRAYVYNFYTNNLNYVDFSIVYFDDPKIISPEKDTIE